MDATPQREITRQMIDVALATDLDRPDQVMEFIQNFGDLPGEVLKAAIRGMQGTIAEKQKHIAALASQLETIGERHKELHSLQTETARQLNAAKPLADRYQWCCKNVSAAMDYGHHRAVLTKEGARGEGRTFDAAVRDAMRVEHGGGAG